MNSPFFGTSFRRWTIGAGVAVALLGAPAAYAADRKLAVSSTSASSSDGLRSPVLGFAVQAESPMLRRIIGTPGAAVLGDAVALPDTVTRVMSAPSGDFVLAETSDSEPVSVLRAQAAEAPSLAGIAGAFSRCDVVEYSSSGSTAALYSASLRRIQVIVGLPDSPSVAQGYDVSSLPAALVSLAVNDAGSVLLVGASDESSGAVFRMTADHLPVKLMDAAHPAAVRFIAETDSALVADDRLNQVTLVSGLSGEPALRQLAGGDEGADGPHQIEVLAGNRIAVVANRNASTLLAIDLQEGKTSRISLTAPAAGLKPVRARAGVMIHTLAPDANWLFSTGADSPVVSFIADATAMAVQQ